MCVSYKYMYHIHNVLAHTLVFYFSVKSAEAELITEHSIIAEIYICTEYAGRKKLGLVLFTKCICTYTSVQYVHVLLSTYVFLNQVSLAYLYIITRFIVASRSSIHVCCGIGLANYMCLLVQSSRCTSSAW